MERLILLCLLSPAIFARPQTKDPNNEPFLPIHPVYPKLIKRGAEQEVNSQLTSELYAPKVDAKDTYTSSYSNNYQRDSYYPDPYSTNSTPSIAYPSPYYNLGETYVYASSPYHIYNSYPASYAVNPTSYSVPSYPNYYYQSPFYYPHYFNHALFPPPPPPPSSGVDYQTSQIPAEPEDDRQDTNKKGERSKENETSQDAPSQFVDDGNYINGNSRDLDVQSSTYKVGNPYNQFTQDAQAKNLPIPLPGTTYRIINVVGQPVNPDYALPVAYIKPQHIEQMTSQALVDLLQNARPQAGRSYENSRDILNSANDGSYESQDTYNPTNAPSYAPVPDARGKTGATYAIDSAGTAKVSGERTKQQSSSSSQRTPSKNTKNVYYIRKATSRNNSQASYAASESRSNNRDRVNNGRPTDQIDKYNSYDLSQNYGTYSQPGNKQEQNYETYQGQPSSYQTKGFTATSQTPQSHGYQYSPYESGQVQQSQQDEINTDNGNFGTKQYKG
ncbi:hypothetical protein P5V15_003964 [Pogonomyrmex californicus]